MGGRRWGSGYDRCPCLIPIILDIPMKINAGRRMRKKADIYLRNVLVLTNHQYYEG